MIRPDWEAIEREYRLGMRSIREIARAHNVSDTAVRKRIAKENWQRDLAEQARLRAAALVRTIEVRKAVRANFGESEQEAVESDAMLLAAAEVEQRANSRRARSIVASLLVELEAFQTAGEALAILPDLVDWSQTDMTARQKLDVLVAFKAATSVSGRVDTMKKLAEALRYVTELERRVLRMDQEDKTSGYAELLRLSEEAQNHG